MDSLSPPSTTTGRSGTRGPSKSTPLTSSSSKSRRDLPPGAVGILKAWLLSPEHFRHPYPTPQDQAMLMSRTGIDKKQLKVRQSSSLRSSLAALTLASKAAILPVPLFECTPSLTNTIILSRYFPLFGASRRSSSELVHQRPTQNMEAHA